MRVDYEFWHGFNSYGKKNAYIGLEDNLQISVANILDLNRKTRGKWCHPPNGGSRTSTWVKGRKGQAPKKLPLEAIKLKKMGTKAGVLDCLIFQHHGKYHGLVIELKVKRKSGGFGSLQDSQKDWLRTFNSLGWYTCICWNTDAVQFVLKHYFSDNQDL